MNKSPQADKVGRAFQEGNSMHKGMAKSVGWSGTGEQWRRG